MDTDHKAASRTSGRHGIGRLLRCAIAVICISALLFQTQAAHIVDLIMSLSAVLFSAATLCIVLWLVCGWLSLFVLLGIKYATLKSLADYCWIQALSGFTPARAGDLLIPLTMKTDTLTPVRLLTVTVLQRVTNLWVIALAGSLVWVSASPDWITVSITAGVLAGGVFAVPSMSVLLKIIPVRWPRVCDLQTRLHSAVQSTPRSRIASHAMLVALRFLINGITGYVTLLAFGIAVPVTAFAEAFTLAACATLVPVSPAGLGISEAVMWTTLQNHGCTVEVVLASSIVCRSLQAIVPLVMSGLAGLLARPQPPPEVPGSLFAVQCAEEVKLGTTRRS